MKLNTFERKLIAIVIALSGAILPATAAERLQVSVPFSFKVGTIMMEAGTYSLSQNHNGMLTVSGAKTSAMVLTIPGEYSNRKITGLSFSSAEGGRILTGVQVSGELGRAIPVQSTMSRATLMTGAR